MLFTDVVGSTAIGDGADPEVLRTLMAGYHRRMREAIERHGGSVVKFIGDGVMAVFGVPRAHEDDALRAVRAALEMQEALAELELPGRIGINTGEVVVHPGDVTGDVVNVAARLEHAAAPGAVLIGEQTFGLVREAVTATAVEPLELKGKSAPVAAWAVSAVGERREGFTRRLDAPLVGREGELRLLTEAYERCRRERRCHLFTILGEAGVGKSRLVGELAAASDGRVLSGQCLSYGEGVTYWPVMEIVRSAAGVAESDDRGEVLGRLGELVAGDDDAGEIARQIACALGLEDAPASTQEIAWAFRRTVEILAAERPVIVVVEDVHWAEPALFDLIDHLTDWSRSASILLIATARPELLELRPGWGGGKTNATTILLEPLAAGACAEMVRTLAAGPRLSAEQAGRIVDAAEGNPLFVEQMLAMVESSGDADLGVPSTTAALLTARLDQLAEDERRVVECGAVEGRVFHRSAVTWLLPDDVGSELADRLRRLIRRELIDPGEAQFRGDEAYRFQHHLIQDAAYQAIPKRERALHHERFAGWLEQVADGRAGDFDSIIAHHLAEAVRYRRELGLDDEGLAARAAEQYRRAADQAALRGDVSAMTALLRRIGDLLPAGHPDAVLATIDVAWWLQGIDDDAAEASAEDALDCAKLTGDPILIDLARLRVAMVSAQGWQIDPREFVGETRKCADAGVAAGEPGIAARALLMEAVAAYEALQRAAMCAEAGQRAAALAVESGDGWLVGVADAVQVSGILRTDGPIDELLARADSIVSRYGRLHRMAYLQNAAFLLAQQGKADLAFAYIDELEASRRELGVEIRNAYHLDWMRAFLWLSAGHPEQAVPLLERALSTMRELDAAGVASTVAGLLGRAYGLTGDPAAAIASAEEARSLTTPGDIVSELFWRGAMARGLAATGRTDEAVPLARELLEIVSDVDVPEYRFYALTDAAEAERAAGNLDEARALLEQALAESERRGATAFVEQATAALAGVDASTVA